MSESELRATILTELRGLNLEFENGEDVVDRIMDAVSEYAQERADDASYNAMIEAGEHYS